MFCPCNVQLVEVISSSNWISNAILFRVISNSIPSAGPGTRVFNEPTSWKTFKKYKI